ncbi:MAG1360 family OppF-related protein [Mycoplasma hafezii]|uniref:MAG1360 family OppF-related protein n=1 Tax=Mycoplasma hafezii TaxID=525886 RepID=UPI003CF892B3
MKENRSILTIRNIFKKVEQADKTEYISIPFLNFNRNEKTALYINNQNDCLTFDRIWEALLHDRNVTLAYTKQNTNNHNIDTRVVIDRGEILKRIAVLDILEIAKETSDELPLFDLWERTKTLPNTEKLNEEVNLLVKDFEIITKNTLYNIISKYSQKIIDINQENIKQAKMISTKLKKGSIITNRALFHDYLAALEQIGSAYRNNIFDVYMDFFQTLKENHLQLLKNYQLSNTIAQKKIVKDGQLKLQYMHKIDNTSINKVDKDLKVYKLKVEREFYLNYKKQINDKAQYLISFLVRSLKKELRILYLKLEQLNKSSPEYFEVYKDIILKKRVLHMLYKNKNKLLYLQPKRIWELNDSLNSEIKVFVNESFRFKQNETSSRVLHKLRRMIKYEFSFKIDSYLIESKETAIDIQAEINKINREIAELNSYDFKKVANAKNEVKIEQFEQQIRLAKAELEWSKFSENKLFNSLLKSKEIKIRRLNNSLRDLYNEVNTLRLQILDLNKNYQSAFENEEDVFEVLRGHFNFMHNSSWMNEIIAQLGNFTISRSSTSKKIVNTYKNVMKFVDMVESISISKSNYLIPYKDLRVVDNAKIKLMQFVLSETKILFIKDNNKDIPLEIRLEFLRVLFKISHKYNFNFVFVTQHLGLIKGNFDKVHFFNNYSLVEGGTVTDVFNEPKHPTVVSLLKSKKYLIPDTRETDLFIYDDVFYVDNTHYVYSSLYQFQKWTDSTFRQSVLGTDMLKNNEYSHNDFVMKEEESNILFESVFEGAEFDLTETPKDEYIDKYIDKCDFKLLKQLVVFDKEHSQDIIDENIELAY